MLIEKRILWVLVLLLITTGCTNHVLPWRSGKLVGQLYRQYKEEILLSYHDLKTEDVVDRQYGYERAYFDNYRKQIIFTGYRANEYWIDGRKFITDENGVGGYVAEVLVNEKYQIGVEILNLTAEDVGQDKFDGAKSRVIDLNTEKSITVSGLLFNRCLINDDYFYGFTFNTDNRQFLDIIRLSTMEHKRFDADNITFLYQKGREVYVQEIKQKQGYKLDGLDMIKKDNTFYSELPDFTGAPQILKDIAPRMSNEHWYVEPTGVGDIIDELRLIQIEEDEIQSFIIKLNRTDVIQVMDVSNYGKGYIALFLTTEDEDKELHAIITIFDLSGKEVASKEITEIRGDKGRFTYLDYVE